MVRIKILFYSILKYPTPDMLGVMTPFGSGVYRYSMTVNPCIVTDNNKHVHGAAVSTLGFSKVIIYKAL